MSTLNLIGKEAVVKHHKDVPYRLLEPVAKLSLPSPINGRGAGGEGDFGGNLIVQGDNLHALKMLLQTIRRLYGDSLDELMQELNEELLA